MTLKKNTWWGVNILFGWFKGRRFYDKTIANECDTNMTVELELEYWRKNIKGHPLVL